MKGFKDSVNVNVPSLHKHNFTHQIFTSMDFYQFRPVLCMQMYPNDEYEVKVSDYFRAEAMATAAYGDANKKYAAFFVPQRILWNKFSDFLTGGSNGRLEFNVPHVKLSDFVSLAIRMHADMSGKTGAVLRDIKAIYRNMLDYWSDLGIPSCELFQADTEGEFNTAALEAFDFPIMEFLACRAIWFNWYRDQNIIGDDLKDLYCPTEFETSGLYVPSLVPQDYYQFDVETANILAPMPVGLEKDYFTTAQTEPQRGGAAFVPVQLPSLALNPGFGNTSENNGYLTINPDNGNQVGIVPFGAQASSRPPQNSTNIIGMFDWTLTRAAKGLQRYMELNGVAGGADLQQLLAQWGIAPNPIVFQRPSYIGSFTDRMHLQEVVSPSDTQDSVAGEVVTKMNLNGSGSFKYKAAEHGYFIIVCTIRPENYYFQGIARERLHGCLGNGKFDFFTPKLEKTGMQSQYLFEITNEWMWDRGQGQENLDPFASIGYAPRYAEDKRQYNRYTGQMSFYPNANKRLCPDYGDVQVLADSQFFIGVDRTMVYGYPAQFRFDRWFVQEDPMYDHFEGWIKFDISALSERNEFAAPLIEDKGNDISLPYGGVRM